MFYKPGFKIAGVLLLLLALVGGFIFPLYPEPRAVMERACIDARCDSYIYNGADVLWYSDDHSTVTARVNGDSGAATFTGLTTAGTLTMNGYGITLDADDDTILRAATEDIALLTTGSATGTFSVRTGNFTVGNGTGSAYARNGEDAYVEGTFEVDGNANFVGLWANVLAVTTSVGVADLNASDDVDINDNLAVNDIVVTATSDLRGNVANSTGLLELADSVDVGAILRVTGAAIFNSTVAVTTSVTAPDGFFSDDLDVNDNVACADLVVTATLSAEDVRSTDDARIADDATVVDNLTANDLIATATLSVDAGKFLVSPVPAAGASGSIIAWTGTLNAMDNSDYVYLLRLVPTNANHTGTNNTLVGLNVGSITGDADANEYGINIASGWDFGIFNMAKLNQYGNIVNDAFGTPDITPVEVDDYLDVAGIFRAYGAAKFATTIAYTTSITGPDAFVTDDLDVNDNIAANDIVATATLSTADLFASDDVDIADNIAANDGYFTATLGAGGATDLLGSASVEGALDLGSHAQFTPTYTPSTPATWMLVPTASYYNIGSGGAVTMTLAITNVVDGQLLIIYGEDGNTVTINDVNLLSVGGSTLALTQYDIGVFIFIGGGVNKWAQISLAGNS